MQISVAYGDGIGPEIMQSVLDIMQAAGADIQWEKVNIGESIYQQGVKTGIPDKTWESLVRTKVFFKAPITTPQGKGFRSLNVTIRKQLGLYANVRPCRAYHPFVSTKYPDMDLVIIRENEEDLYAGMEYQQTQDLVQCLKIISQSGSRRIARFAYEYAVHHQRKKVTCFTKDNIMKKTDGLFRKVFEQVGKAYPSLEKEHWIIDIGAAKMAATPENFDVLVLPNLYGDILSDIAAQISGSVGMAGSANIGDQYAMFEAIHGSAPRRAGQNLANPSGLLQAGVMMLNYIGQNTQAEVIQNAWLKTLEDGLHTYDIYQTGISHKKVSTKDFTRSIIQRLGKLPQKLKPVTYKKTNKNIFSFNQKVSHSNLKKTLVGVDVFIDSRSPSVEGILDDIQAIHSGELQLQSISSRGLEVWPKKPMHVLLSDHWQLRFMHSKKIEKVKAKDIITLLTAIEQKGLDFTQVELLYLFDGKPGFSGSEG